MIGPGHLLTPLRADPKDAQPRQGLTPVELLLGEVEDYKSQGQASARALASRVRVFDAIALRQPRLANQAINLPNAQGWSRAAVPSQESWWNPGLIDETALAVLTTLGDPDMLAQGAPVHTPLTEQHRQANPVNPGRTESDTFKWFVSNVNAQEVLRPIVPGQQLPTLPYLFE